jgi:coproporphyrinogen III oxidase-like Fe-S oxidoreductase
MNLPKSRRSATISFRITRRFPNGKRNKSIALSIRCNTVRCLPSRSDYTFLGESAFGYFAGFHYQNTDDLSRYLEVAKVGQLPVSRAYQLSQEELLRREVVLQLKTGKLSRAYFSQKFGIESEAHFSEPIQLLRQHGYLKTHNGDIQLTEAGLLQVDSLLENFYLPKYRGVRYT